MAWWQNVTYFFLLFGLDFFFVCVTLRFELRALCLFYYLSHTLSPAVFLLPDPARELKVLVSNLLELLTEAGVSGQGRNNALSLLIKTVPRKSPKDPSNSLTLWVIDQGR
jgi:hypothetical protein